MGFTDPPPYAGPTGSVTSADGTTIAFDRSGEGSAVILVDGVTFHRAYGPSRALAEHLTGHGYTVYAYDRRGRGESGDTEPYAAEREVQDIAALIEHAGVPVHLFAATSGAVLALDAVAAGLDVASLALFDPPFLVDGSRRPVPEDFVARLEQLIGAGRLAEAQSRYLTSQMPALRLVMPLLRVSGAMRRSLSAVPSLARDAALFAELQTGQPLPAQRWRDVEVATMVVTGRRSPAWVRAGAQALTGVLPNASLHTMGGNGHFVQQDALATVLAAFFADPVGSTRAASGEQG